MADAPEQLVSANDFWPIAGAIVDTADNTHTATADLVAAYQGSNWDDPKKALSYLEQYVQKAKERFPSPDNAISPEEANKFIPVKPQDGEDVATWESLALKTIDESKDPNVVARKQGLKENVQSIATKQFQDQNNGVVSYAGDLSSRVLLGLGGGAIKALHTMAPETADVLSNRLNRNLRADSNDTFMGDLATGVGSVGGVVANAPVFIGTQVLGSADEYNKSRELGGSKVRAYTAVGLDAANQALNLVLSAKLLGPASKVGTALGVKALETAVPEIASITSRGSINAAARLAAGAVGEGVLNTSMAVGSEVAKDVGNASTAEQLGADLGKIKYGQTAVVGAILGAGARAVSHGETPAKPLEEPPTSMAKPAEDFAKTLEPVSTGQEATKLTPEQQAADAAAISPQPGEPLDVQDQSPFSTNGAGQLTSEVPSTDLVESFNINATQELLRQQVDPPREHSTGEAVYGQPPEGSNLEPVEHPGGTVLAEQPGEGFVGLPDGTIQRVVDGEAKTPYAKATVISEENAVQLAALQTAHNPDGTAVDVSIDEVGNVVATSPYLKEDLTFSDTPLADQSPRVIPPVAEGETGHVVQHDELPLENGGTDKKTTISKLPINNISESTAGAQQATPDTFKESTTADRLRTSLNIGFDLSKELGLDKGKGLSVLQYRYKPDQGVITDAVDELGRFNNDIGAFALSVLAKEPNTTSASERLAMRVSALQLQQESALPENAANRDAMINLAGRLANWNMLAGADTAQLLHSHSIANLADDGTLQITQAYLDQETNALIKSSEETGLSIDELKRSQTDLANLDNFEQAANKTEETLQQQSQALEQAAVKDDAEAEKEVTSVEGQQIQAEIAKTEEQAKAIDAGISTADSEIKALENEAVTNHAQVTSELQSEVAATEAENKKLEVTDARIKRKTIRQVENEVAAHEAELQHTKEFVEEVKAKSQEEATAVQKQTDEQIKTAQESLNNDLSKAADEITKSIEGEQKDLQSNLQDASTELLRAEKDSTRAKDQEKAAKRVAKLRLQVEAAEKELADFKKSVAEREAEAASYKKGVTLKRKKTDRGFSIEVRTADGNLVKPGRANAARPVLEAIRSNLSKLEDNFKTTKKLKTKAGEKQTELTNRIKEGQKLLNELRSAPDLTEKSAAKIAKNKENISKLRDLVAKSKPEDTLTKSQLAKLNSRREGKAQLSEAAKALNKQLQALKAKKPKVDQAKLEQIKAEKKAQRASQRQALQEKKDANNRNKKRIAEQKVKLTGIDKIIKKNLDHYRDALTPERQTRITALFKALGSAIGDKREKIKYELAKTIFEIRGIENPGQDALLAFWRGNVLSGLGTIAKHSTTVGFNLVSEPARLLITGRPGDAARFVTEVAKNIFSPKSLALLRDGITGNLPFTRDLPEKEAKLGLGFEGIQSRGNMYSDIGKTIDEAFSNTPKLTQFLARTTGQVSQFPLAVLSAVDAVASRANQKGYQRIEGSHKADYRQWVSDNYDRFLMQAHKDQADLDALGIKVDKGWINRRADELQLLAEPKEQQTAIRQKAQTALLKRDPRELGVLAQAYYGITQLANKKVGKEVATTDISKADTAPKLVGGARNVVYAIFGKQAPLREKITGETLTPIVVEGLGEGRKVTIGGKAISSESGISTTALLDQITTALANNSSIELSGTGVAPLKYVLGQFGRTSANLIDMGMSYLPGIGALDAAIGGKIKNKVDAHTLYANQLVGATIISGLVMKLWNQLDKEDTSDVAFYGPLYNSKYRGYLASKGITPDSFRIGTSVFHYAHIPGVNALFSVVGQLQDAVMTAHIDKQSPVSAFNEAGLIGAGLLHMATSGPSLKNLAQLADLMVADPSKTKGGVKGLALAAANVMSGFVPLSGAERDLSRLQYGDLSRPYDFQSKIINTFPIAQFINPQRPALNMWGEPIRASAIPGLSTMYNDSKPVFETNWLLRNGYHVSVPEGRTRLTKGNLKQFGEARGSENPDTFEPFLDREEHYQYMKLIGPQMKQTVNAYAKSYPTGFNQQVQDRLDKEITRIKRDGRTRILSHSYVSQ